jgi:O-antigen/teichoic acid export membrane protein
MIGSLFSSETRTGRFFRTLSSSYVLLVAATLYSLGVVPIILNFSGTASLGLWSLVVQFGTYLTLLDAGLSGACIRQFVGPLVREDHGALAGKFQNALALASIQGLLIATAGFAGGWLVPWLGIPASEAQLFAGLFAAQCCLVALEFPFRPFNSLLLAQQRFEFNYLVTGFGMILSLGLVWWGMASGLGLWSLILAGGFQALVKTGVSLLCVARFYGLRGFFSESQVRWHNMKQLLTESGSFFSGTMFGALGGVAQATLLSRWFGLDGVAAWNVGSKAANLLSQLLSKFYESSFAGLSELFESGRTDLLLKRLGQLFGWVLGISLFAAVGISLFNGVFIRIWTDARIPWSPALDVAVALWLVGLTAFRGLGEQTKILLVWRWIRLGPVLEFLIWLGLAPWLAHRLALPGFVLGCALAPFGSACMIYLYGLRLRYRGVGASLITREARGFVAAGGFLFLISALWGLMTEGVWMHAVLLLVSALIFLWLFIPRIGALVSSLTKNEGPSR